MTATPGDDLTATYLARLRAAVADLPETVRADVLGRVSAHLAVTVPAGSGEGAVRNALDELGPPGRIAAAARERHAPRSPAPAGAAGRVGGRTSAPAYDVLTVLLVLLGGFAAPVVGWLAGVVMLWVGPRWSVGDKLLGTLVAPGLAVAAVVAFPVLATVVESQFLVVAGIVLAGILVLGATFRRLLGVGRGHRPELSVTSVS